MSAFAFLFRPTNACHSLIKVTAELLSLQVCAQLLLVALRQLLRDLQVNCETCTCATSALLACALRSAHTQPSKHMTETDSKTESLSRANLLILLRPETLQSCNATQRNITSAPSIGFLKYCCCVVISSEFPPNKTRLIWFDSMRKLVFSCCVVGVLRKSRCLIQFRIDLIKFSDSAIDWLIDERLQFNWSANTRCFACFLGESRACKRVSSRIATGKVRSETQIKRRAKSQASEAKSRQAKASNESNSDLICVRQADEMLSRFACLLGFRRNSSSLFC